MIMPYLIINILVSCMNLKKWKGIYEYICWDRALVLWKKNLPSRGLTKFEKHWVQNVEKTIKTYP